jgi:hypothetical protein
MSMTAPVFCRCVKRCVEETLAPLHVKVTVHTPKRLPVGAAAFCHIAVEAYIDLPGDKGKRQFATLTISPVRSEITGGVMVNSHAISLLKQVVKEYAFYIKMHTDAMAECVQGADRILAEIRGIS